MTIKNKIVKVKDIAKIAESLKKQKKKIVTTNGVFDILHYGHVSYLEEAKKLGDVLIVGVNSDASVKINKGDKRPINNEKSRSHVVAALESVDYAVLFNDKDPRKFLSLINPDFHVKAGDYNPSQIIEKEIVEKNGGKVVIAKAHKSYSTTSIISKILNAYKKQ